jgi:hypothetical protein
MDRFDKIVILAETDSVLKYCRQNMIDYDFRNYAVLVKGRNDKTETAGEFIIVDGEDRSINKMLEKLGRPKAYECAVVQNGMGPIIHFGAELI